MQQAQALISPITISKQDDSVEAKSAGAVAAILRIFERGQSVSVSFSGGKDSSVLMHLGIDAAVQAKAKGLNPHLVVLSSDTGVENPEVAMLLRREHVKIRKHLTAAGVEHKVVLTQPSLASSWAVRVLGGTKLPTFPGAGHDCSIDFKVAPIAAARKALFKELGKGSVVTLIGTRFEESAQRAKAMAERGELAEEPYTNDAGEQVMSPIAFFTTDDVWEFIGLVRAGVVTSYSDFEDTFKLYADAGGTSCAVVSDAITESTKAARGGCGARFGCAVCCVVNNDVSLETMISTDPQYSYMKGLSDFRNLLVKTRWDFSKRFWVQRSINRDGLVTLQPDCYSPAFLLELFQFGASLDAQEARESRRLGISPRFSLLSVEAVVAIDALWSLNGYHAPHTALLTWLSFQEGTSSYRRPDVAKVPEAARAPLPAAMHVYAGEVWDGEEHAFMSGHFSPLVALADCDYTRLSKDGRTVPQWDTVARMEVDVESFYLALDFEMDGIRARNAESSRDSDWTSGYRFWTQYGTLTLAATQMLEHDHVLRRTAWRARQGFIGEAGNLKAQAMAKELAAVGKEQPGEKLGAQRELFAAT